jgi:hypothetical protein
MCFWKVNISSVYMHTNTARFLGKSAGKYTEFANSYSKILLGFRIPSELKKNQSYQMPILSVSDVPLPAFEPHNPFQNARFECFVILDHTQFMATIFYISNYNTKKIQVRSGSNKSLNVVPEFIFMITDLVGVCRLFEGKFCWLWKTVRSPSESFM